MVISKKVIKILVIGIMLTITVLSIFKSLVDAREQVDIQILTMKFGGTGYVAGFVLADIINKHSSWLRATAVETGGTVDNIKIISRELNRRKKLIGWASFETFHSARNAIPPFQEKYRGKLTWLVHITTFVPHFVAINKNIQKGQDLVGRRIGLPVAGSGGTVLPTHILKDAWEIYKDVKIEYLGWGSSAKALIDGRVDAAWITGVLIEGKLQPVPGLEEFFSSGIDFHPISISPDDLRKIREKTGYPAYGMIVKPKTLHPKQADPVYIPIVVNGFFADSELPDDIAYEVVRIIYENYKKFGEHHASLKGLSPEILSLGGAAEECHPGATKFYKEKGLKIGF